VEKDLGERIDVATKHPKKIAELQRDLENIEKQIKKEGSFWQTN